MLLRSGKIGTDRAERLRIAGILVLVALPVCAVVVAQGAGFLPVSYAAALLFAPVVVAATALRPAWLVLFLAAVPLSLIRFVPTDLVSLLLAATLIAQLIMRDRVFLGFRSGVWPLIALAIGATIFRTDAGAGELAAAGFRDVIIYVALLTAVAYNATRLGDLDAGQLIDALIIGALLAVFLEQFGFAKTSFGPGTGGGEISSIGRNVGYVGAMGFSLALGRFVFPLQEQETSERRWIYVVAAAIFAFITVVAFVRTAWLAALITVVLFSAWAGKRRYWLVVPLVVLVIAVVPVARERVLPGSEGGINQALADTARLTTGRWDLWTALWNDLVPSLPEGHGYGHTFSLTPQRIFGFQTFQRVGSPTSFVYPHNDFLFWTLELGLFGFAALSIFWVQLLGGIRRLTRSPLVRSSGIYPLAGIVVTMLLVQLIDNSFAIRAVSDRFFITAGYALGMVGLYRASLQDQE